MKTCIVTFNISNKGIIPLNNLLEIITNISNNVILISGGIGLDNITKNIKNLDVFKIKHNKADQNILRVVSFIKTQLSYSNVILKNKNKFDIIIFFVGGESLIMPIIISKIFKKKILILSAGSGYKVAKHKGDSLSFFLRLMQYISYTLSNNIILYSPRLINENNLTKYSQKIFISTEHYIDTKLFYPFNNIEDRENLIGFIGSLTKSKGFNNFVIAMRKIIDEKYDVKFIIGGEGESLDILLETIKYSKYKEKIDYIGWVDHNILPNYLNKLKLFVLPSYSEGLPNTILESMACGTPVLATQVGGIPDIIKDEETGFLMDNNSSECITENIKRALKHSNLEDISKDGRKLIENEFTFEKAVDRFRKIVDEL